MHIVHSLGSGGINSGGGKNRLFVMVCGKTNGYKVEKQLVKNSLFRHCTSFGAIFLSSRRVLLRLVYE